MASKKPKREKHDHAIGVKYTAAEHALISARASEARLPIGTWIRMQTVLAAELGDKK